MITDPLPGETFGHGEDRKDIRKTRNLRIEGTAQHREKAEEGLVYTDKPSSLKFFQGLGAPFPTFS